MRQLTKQDLRRYHKGLIRFDTRRWKKPSNYCFSLSWVASGTFPNPIRDSCYSFKVVCMVHRGGISFLFDDTSEHCEILAMHIIKTSKMLYKKAKEILSWNVELCPHIGWGNCFSYIQCSSPYLWQKVIQPYSSIFLFPQRMHFFFHSSSHASLITSAPLSLLKINCREF